MKPPIKPLSFLALGNVLSPNHREKVVACAFAHYKQGVSNELSQKVKGIFNQRLRIDGFKHAAIAPIERVRRQALRQLPFDPLLSSVITDLWIEANAELEAASRQFTEESNFVVKDIFAKKGQDIEGWSVEMQEIVAKFRAQYDQYDENDVFLIFSCVLEQSFPELEKMDKEASCHDVNGDSSKEDEEEDSGEANVVTQIEENCRKEPSNNFFRSSVLQQWFEELKALPADAPEWLEVGEFATALERLAEEKRVQCSQQRVKLQTVIESLNASVTESLSYFEFVTCRSWQADVVPLHEAETAANQVAEFHSALERHAQFRAQKATTRQEDRARLDEMSHLEEQILLLHQQLNALLEPVEGKNESVAPVTDNDVSFEEQPDFDSTSYEDQCINASASSAAASIREDESPSNYLDALPLASKATPIADNEESERPPEDACANRELVDNASASPSINIVEGQANLPRSVTNGDDSNWDNLLWSLLEKNDPAAGYWLSYALNAARHRGAVSEQLLAALCGGASLPFDSNLLAQDLAEIVRTYQCAETDSALALLEIAAALRPTLIAPNAGLQVWLHKTHLSPSLNKLTAAVIDFAGSGNAFPRPTIAHPPDVRPTEAVANLTAEAAQWLLNAPARRNINKAATDVWRKLTKEQGELWRLLDWVSHNQHQHKNKILEAVRQWEDRDWSKRRINELHAETVPGKKVQPITGTPFQQLVRDIRDGCQIASRWCVAITHNGNTQGDWLATQTAKLRDLAQEALPLAENELQEAALSLQANRSLTAATNYLLHALQHTRFLFQLPPTETEEPACRLWGTVNDVDLPLNSLLAQRLWTLPELHLNDDGQPVGNPIEIALTIEQVVKEKRTLETSFARLLQEQDFRFAKPLLASLPDKKQATRLEQGLNNALADARACFSAESLNVLEEVEQGVVDGIISDVQRAEYSSEIERLDSEDLLDIRSAMNRLRAVSQKLASARELRLSYLDEKWAQMKAAVAERLGADKFAQASAFVQNILERRDTRVIDECLAQIREALESGSELDESWFAAPQKRAHLEEFLRAAPEIEVWLQQHDGELSALQRYVSGGSIGSWTIGELPRVRRQEAGAAVKAWIALWKGKARAQDAAAQIAEVLRFLGFTPLGAAADVEVKIERRSTGWLHARAHASTGDLSKPIPQFGSLATGSHDLLCFWDRPSTEVIGARLHETRLSGQSLLVLYFTPLCLKERIEIAKLARDRALNIAVMDDVLLTFLIGEKDAHLPAFLRCTLPFSGVDPYTPFKAGDVPPEMYFGREDMERSLRSPSESCLVYGGRQLGKSALLRHAQRQFHQPERERFAVVEDIKMIGDAQSGQPIDAIWRRILEGFVRLGLMKRTTTNKPDEIRRAVRDVMRQVPDRFVLVMLDEADNFLDADAADNFRVVTDLRNLMTVTDRRFKVVFAGLQNVQRFHGIPNQPLVHFGRPISVGPLEPKAAQSLVSEPFEALGFRFADKAAVLRILSYTNYHAGLIQIFCQELLRRLRAKLGDAEPPYFIQRSDVEGVYRSRDVRDCIRERFDWTLALKPSYQAVAWTMIADQMETHDSYTQPYSAAEIKRLAEGWWPQGFSSVGGDELRGLLDEMCGLGVLVRDASGYYRLRSPNLVRLIGTETDIVSRLLELSERAPEVKYDADSHHAQLDEKRASYSPITYMQERLLNPPQFGVGLIFASQALGLAELEPAVKRFIPADLPTEVQSEFSVIPSAVASTQELEAWLRDFVEAKPKHERLIVFQHITGSAVDALARVRESVRFCRSRRSQKQWLRVIFLFDEAATWQWLLLPIEERHAIEEQVDASVTVRRWNLSGVRQRLSQSDKMHSDEVCQAVLRATGGWPWLLDHLLKNCQEYDSRNSAATFARRLANPNDSLSQQWRKMVMPGSDHPASQVLHFISREQEENGVPRELITPEFGVDALKEECDAAVEFLLRMGLLDTHDQLLLVEPVVQFMLKADG